MLTEDLQAFRGAKDHGKCYWLPACLQELAAKATYEAIQLRDVSTPVASAVWRGTLKALLL